jgi:hypothetical protein
MKALKLVYTLMACFTVILSYANGFQKDTVYLYALPHTADSSSVYLVVKGHFPTSCMLQCSSVSKLADTTIVKAGYYEGIATITCPVHDTFFVANYPPGLVTAKVIVGGNVLVACDSFYTTTEYVLNLPVQLTDVYSLTEDLFVLFTNPGNQKLTISSGIYSAIQYAVVNTSGQQLMQGGVAQHNFTLDVGALPPGLYFLQLNAGNTMVVKRFIKY